jgi:glycerophosphoryl diester phosphodiesterase
MSKGGDNDCRNSQAWRSTKNERRKVVMRISCLLICAALSCISAHAAELVIVAHRGASKAAPENTLPAFELAWKQGADAIEGDFHLTKDRQIVCIHDGNTKKVASQNLVIKKSTLAELKMLDVGAKKGKPFAGTTIPTLAEVFATVPQTKKIYVEIKCGPEIIPVLREEIKKSKLEIEQIVLISFSKDVIRDFKEAAPEHKAYWLSRIKKDKSGSTASSVESASKTLKDIKADGLSASNSGIDAGVIKSIQAKGYEFHVWTVDDVKTAERFKSWGAQSITTNVPSLIRKGLVSTKAK